MNGRRIARWGVALLIGVPIPIATLLMLTIYTETGSRWVLAQALRSAPGVMQIGGFRGRLMDQFELIDVDVKATVVSARIDSVSIRWRPLALFKGEFIVESTALDGVDLTFKSRTSESEAPTPSALPAPPLPLEVQRLDLRNIRIHLAGQEFIVDHLGLRAEWSTARLALNGFEVKAYGHRFGAAGSVAVGHRPKVAVSADWAGAIGGEQGTASLEIKGPLNELAFETTIEAHASGRLSGSINPLADVPKLSLQGNIAALDLGDNMTLGETRVDIVGSLESLVVSIAADASTVQTGAYALSLDTEIALIGATDDTITAEINWQAKPTRAGSEDLVGSGRLRYDGKAVRIDHATAAPYRTRVAGTVELGSDEPMLDLELGWNDIKYSLSDGQEVIARDGTALFEGPLKNINIELVSAFDVSPMGPVELTGNFRSNEQRLFVQQLTVALLQGQVQTVGKINFTEGVEGDFEFSGSDLDFSALNAETPSRLGFSGSAHFNSATNGITSQVELSTLTGYLRGHALSGAALVHTRPRALTIDHMHLNAGSNRIDLRGNWGEQMNGEFDLQLDELAVLDQRLTGTIAGHGTFSGNPTLPQIKAQFTGSALRFDRFAAGSLNADIDYDMLREAESNVDFNIDEISIDGKAFGELTFAGRGNSQAHALQLVLDGEPLTLQATASGTFGEHDWQGRVSGLETDSDIAGAWSLVAPVEIALAKDAASFTDACLASGAARACISGNHRTAGSSARIRLAALPLALADHFMPATLRLRGATNGTIDLVATNGVITGTGNVRLSNGIIERDRGDGEPDKLQIRTFTVDFDVLPDSIRAEANADVEQWFTLHGTVSAERTRGGVVSAAIDAQADDIGWIAEFVPELSGSTGTLALTSALSGTIDHPQGSANLKLSQGALQVP
ncbi:MAG: translocation and assembly module TamB, partial [Gammaproteobacteria bacterium]